MHETWTSESVAQAKPDLDAVIREVCHCVVGQDQAVKLLVAACLAGGHALLEDVPGTGKTKLASSLAAALGLSFARVQGTPDLLPADVIGTTVYHPREEAFRFHPGPIFTQVLLFDEINRATPRTQSALLQAMAERAVTVDGEERPLPRPFFVLATANPVESQGVFPLPEAELDRFLVQVSLGYLPESLEIEMVKRVMAEGADGPAPAPVLGADRLVKLQHMTQRVFVHDDVVRYAVSLARRTRDHDQISLGASPRSAVWLVRLSQALALLAGRHFVTPDDVQEAFVPVMRHRLVYDIAWADRGERDRLLESILGDTPVPHEREVSSP
ncbi:AAA family ATPase [Alicyclobacillus acidocaldarius]|uniref:ATPase associated with various cellular activities AAA_3 n=1 Tax=Alicyclobacillus acidocaldarius (strain Tc-4-1) TaxID=1048834 RepID=F8IFT7_ALIAT|nr:MoxR family ATPase [Alicyclobacillus acidocaldarius]AEJ44171.1 ATPase associated with various cellular activities AAA_3 [Alicyclobacillus acidocaldarius subsp. acidocaldarius Tc-4-1]